MTRIFPPPEPTPGGTITSDPGFSALKAAANSHRKTSLAPVPGIINCSAKTLVLACDGNRNTERENINYLYFHALLRLQVNSSIIVRYDIQISQLSFIYKYRTKIAAIFFPLKEARHFHNKYFLHCGTSGMLFANIHVKTENPNLSTYLKTKCFYFHNVNSETNNKYIYFIPWRITECQKKWNTPVTMIQMLQFLQFYSPYCLVLLLSAVYGSHQHY